MLTTASLATADGLAELEGRIEIDGSSTVAPITIKVAHRFRSHCPKVKVPVAISGTGGGFKRFTRGDTDISNASRPMRGDERARCVANGVQFVELPVAYDGLTVVSSLSDRWIDYLSVEELSAIFRSRQPAETWSDVRPGWPRTEIKIFSPGTDSGTFDYFQELVAGDGTLRDDMSVSEDDNQLVTGVASSQGGLSFFGAGYFFGNADKLRAIPIVNPATGIPVKPTVETIADGSYAPFSRPLFIYVNAASVRRPEIKHFVEFYLENASEIAKSVGYLGLPSELYNEAFRRLEAPSKPLHGPHSQSLIQRPRTAAVGELYVEENLIE